jgi:hypothetical protein
MKKRSAFLGIAGIILALGFVLAGCPNDTTEESDTWSNVTSLNQMNGTWKGSYSQSMTVKELVEENGETWTSEMQTAYGDMKVTASAEMTFTINSSSKTQSMSVIMTQTYSGGNIATVWTEIVAELSEQPGFTFNNEKHSITITLDIPAQQISDEDIAEMLNSGLQINQTGKKIKIPAGQMVEGAFELIMVKQ